MRWPFVTRAALDASEGRIKSRLGYMGAVLERHRSEVERAIKFQLEAEITPEKLGAFYAENGSDFQAKFWNEVGRRMRSWDRANGEMQICFIAGDERMDENGLWAMERHYEFAKAKGE